MRYPFVFYVESLPNGMGGTTNGPVIRILNRLRNDEGIYQHELTHAKQWFCTLGLLPFLTLIPKFRFWVEVQAYKKQAEYYPDDRRWQFAGFIANRYGLDVTQEQAFEALK